MKAFVAGAMLSAIGATGQTVGTGGITQVLALAGFGGVITLFVRAWLDRKKDGAQLANQALGAIQESLESVTAMRKELDGIYAELGRVQQDLHQANVQIGELQRKLENANGDRDRLKHELELSVHARDALQTQLAELQDRMAELEAIQDRKGD